MVATVLINITSEKRGSANDAYRSLGNIDVTGEMRGLVYRCHCGNEIRVSQ